MVNPLWRPAYVAIGSNLNDPQAQVQTAMVRLAALPLTRSLLRSRLYKTRPMGPQDQPYFMNAAAGLLTQLSARELLAALLQIEQSMGRKRQERWGPRVIDLDLIWMPGENFNEPGLTLPHPGVSMRNFVLYPLADIAPTLAIPGHGNVSELLRAVGDEGISVLELHENCQW
jgi:2-amino-4-hydroxy-6-hydroxymethyldihydropteridine diphosphokinase